MSLFTNDKTVGISCLVPLMSVVTWSTEPQICIFINSQLSVQLMSFAFYTHSRRRNLTGISVQISSVSHHVHSLYATELKWDFSSVYLVFSTASTVRIQSNGNDMTAEMTRLRRLLRHDKMRNETVRGILCQETTLADRIAERRLNCFGLVSRMGSEQKHYTAAISMGKETKEDNRRNGRTI